MSRQITEYRVFIASPGGLQEERQRFRDALIEYNVSDALPRGVTFTPVGWEDTLGGIGRPQSLINRELKECDFFVLVLWDRWGTPPDYNEGRYTSGTEEEFAVAREALIDGSAPMQQIVAFFKGVDPKQLSDPGPQLSKVLDFRKQLETTKALLFQTFDTPDRFAMVLRRHLGMWLLAHEERSTSQPYLPSESSPDPDASRGVEPSGEMGGGDIEEAWRLSNEGRRTDAETVFSRAIVRANDPRAFIEFGRFLYRDGRLDQALVMFERSQELATSRDEQASAAAAFRWIGHIWKVRGKLNEAEEFYRTALEIDEKSGRSEGLANDYNALGIVLSRRGDLVGAEAMHRKALELFHKDDHWEGMANCTNNLGNVLYMRGDLAGAEAMHRAALEANEILDRIEGRSNSYGNLGLVLYRRGDLAGAEEMHRKAIAIDEMLKRPEGLASGYGNLGLVLHARGDLVGAETMLRKALEINEAMGRVEGTAFCYFGLGDIAGAQGHWDAAREFYEKSLAGFEQVGIPDRLVVLRKRLANLQDISFDEPHAS